VGVLVGCRFCLYSALFASDAFLFVASAHFAVFAVSLGARYVSALVPLGWYSQNVDFTLCYSSGSLELLLSPLCLTLGSLLSFFSWVFLFFFCFLVLSVLFASFCIWYDVLGRVLLLRKSLVYIYRALVDSSHTLLSSASFFATQLAVACFLQGGFAGLEGFDREAP